MHGHQNVPKLAKVISQSIQMQNHVPTTMQVQTDNKDKTKMKTKAKQAVKLQILYTPVTNDTTVILFITIDHSGSNSDACMVLSWTVNRLHAMKITSKQVYCIIFTEVY